MEPISSYKELIQTLNWDTEKELMNVKALKNPSN